MNFAAIEDALDELRAGRIILCMDDPDRENEGDMICAAQFATTENVNFMYGSVRLLKTRIIRIIKGKSVYRGRMLSYLSWKRKEWKKNF